MRSLSAVLPAGASAPGPVPGVAVLLALALGAAASAPAQAPLTAPEEAAFAQQFVQARFLEPSPPPQPGLVVDYANSPVQVDHRGAGPLRVAGHEVAHGLFAHADSRIVVHLGAAARTLRAGIGLDDNEQTRGGRGSVVFVVRVGGREAYRSPVVRLDTPPAAIEVPLLGASGFVLEVEDAGDGIGWDQADWIEPQVEMADGAVVALHRLPILADHEGLLAGEAPFSFRLDGVSSRQLLPGWEVRRSATALDPQRTAHTLAFTDPATRLEVRAEAVAYRDFPVVEWTLHVTNGGKADAPLLTDLRALDLRWQRLGTADFLLHHAIGSPADGHDYEPLASPLPSGRTRRFGGAGGRPTAADWSYFDLECGDHGVVVAIGWPGQWAMEFERDADRGLRLRAGQEQVQLRLHPGESVRTPSVLLLWWRRGDWLRAQNLWRRWMMAHGMPRPGGALPRPMLLASSSRAYGEMIGADEGNQIAHIDRYLEERLGLDYWWMDAGWYVQQSGWPQVGTWEVDPRRFPRGLRPVSDHAHAHGLRTLLWFEPERVAAGTWLAQQHPEWIAGGERGGLLDLGNPAARAWTTERIDSVLTAQGIDLYRQDFNMDPLGSWRGKDAPDRQGLTEIRHVEGLLAFWDELRRRHPDMLIDACASGGRRNDLESMRRAVPLWRSDYAYEPVGHQCMTYGISLWLPFHGTGTVAATDAPYYGGGRTAIDDYAFWSNAAPSLGLGIDVRERDLDYGRLRALLAQWRQLSAFYYGDFWPLTTCTHDPGAWIGWQFDRPEQGDGVVQVFRRAASVYEAARLPMRGLDPARRYECTRWDDGSVTVVDGAELLQRGLPVAIASRPAAVVVGYRALPPR